MFSQGFADTNLEDRSYKNKGNLNLECCSHRHRGMLINDLLIYARSVYVLGLEFFFYVNCAASSPSSFFNRLSFVE